MKKIVVIGSLNMDFAVQVKDAPKTGETVMAEGMALIPGGKGANQAFAAAKLGGRVTMLGAVGADTYGKVLADNLAAAGADVSHLKVTDEASTGIALVEVDHTGDNRIIVISGTNALVDIPYIDSKMDVIAESDIVVMQLEIPLETVVHAAKAAKKLGKLVILDPAPARTDLPDELLANVDIIKPNEHEVIAILGGGDISQKEAARQLKEKGAASVLVTMGGAGSCYYAADGTVTRADAFKVNAIDTTGAGDSYTAALAVAIAEGANMADAMALASKVGAMVTTKAGAQTSIPSRAEVIAWNAES